MKKSVVVLLALALSVSMFGCAKEEKQVYAVNENLADVQAEQDQADAAEEVVINAKDIADALAGLSYDDNIAEVDLDTAKMFLNLDGVDIVESYVYESSGATAEEIVVLKCADAANASKAKDVFSQRIEEQTENFTDYVPEELPKLKDAVIAVNGEYAVLSVSKDASKAKEIVAGIIGK